MHLLHFAAVLELAASVSENKKIPVIRVRIPQVNVTQSVGGAPSR